MDTSRKRSALRAAVAALAALALGAPAAQAACPTPEGGVTQAFADWNDSSWYAPIGGGTFEDGAAGWTLTGAARVVAADSPFGAPGAGALELAGKASATTPPICVETGYPYARAFGVTTVKARNASQGGLKVELLYRDARRGETAVEVGVLPEIARWDALRRVATTQGAIAGAPVAGETYVRFRVSPRGGSTWRLDDAYVDPRMFR